MSADAIIIGAGHNGLACALHLASRGWKVLVLESSDTPGGAVKTAQVTLPGFRHDLYAMNLSLFAGSAFHAEHGATLARHGLAFIAAARPFASAFAEGSSPAWLGLEQGLEATLARIGRVSARDAQAWRALDARFEREAPHLFALLGAPLPSWQAARALWRMGRSLGLAGMADSARLLLSSPRDWLSDTFESEAVRCLLAAWGLHLDFAPDVAGGALFPYLEAMAGQRFGMALGQGGADVIVRAMVAALRAAGGELRTGARVRRIHVAGGRAQSVELDDGQRIEARRAVIANVHPGALYGALLGAAAPPDSAQARDLRPGPATMMIHLALDALPAWRASTELQTFAYVHLAPSLQQMAQVYTQAMAGLLPHEPVLVVGQPTAFDPSRAPAGKHVLWVQVRVLPAKPCGDAAGQIAAAHWDDIKDAYAERVLDILERYAPGLRGSVLGRCVLSPADLERDNPNLVGGDSLSGSHHLDQFFLFRPAFGRSRWRTGVGGLFHIGASTWPGAGTGAASGYLLARDLSD
ncbi:phytoene desaturase family protein [Verminephrobacter eiseniae]|uniref:phytoene desaturase family protein n=1 Tax=Verminephrobacter eiseniae TaxID=364317 RepID=UPI0010EDA679|nr:NAD(P)/FAD-dependent oxidoreductase [Verminephrobacter eiseniae]KAB7634555.1 NAD(P)/FAD-dependent oxidoreductase [Verminephrobacter sp. Larva24]MCW5234745.1 NAD(P)/FAD-dependent oxidoreductase [Verminephrobacter eiseniae]MCW5293680.1 NAD(P)/FAD-dependent oxidoreductase [Verminephrobacter eiseniae]MCW8183471.1 NAD(P)/FAD-dependent oxidoreductase [Verminephrobacter eiseniae]MCW8224716.1 NAD(P)/FAD-dependent oxidoreductase [Verminephrobacter eiseniae]